MRIYSSILLSSLLFSAGAILPRGIDDRLSPSLSLDPQIQILAEDNSSNETKPCVGEGDPQTSDDGPRGSGRVV